MDARALLAAVLGVGLGVVLLAAPDAVARAHLAGRVPTDRGGEYGEDSALSERWRRLVQLLGLATVGLGLYFGATAVGVL